MGLWLWEFATRCNGLTSIRAGKIYRFCNISSIYVPNININMAYLISIYRFKPISNPYGNYSNRSVRETSHRDGDFHSSCSRHLLNRNSAYSCLMFGTVTPKRTRLEDHTKDAPPHDTYRGVFFVRPSPKSSSGSTLPVLVWLGARLHELYNRGTVSMMLNVAMTLGL